MEWSSLVMRIPGVVPALERSRNPEVTEEPVLRWAEPRSELVPGVAAVSAAEVTSQPGQD